MNNTGHLYKEKKPITVHITRALVVSRSGERKDPRPLADLDVENGNPAPYIGREGRERRSWALFVLLDLDFRSKNFVI